MFDFAVYLSAIYSTPSADGFFDGCELCKLHIRLTFLRTVVLLLLQLLVILLQQVSLTLSSASTALVFFPFQRRPKLLKRAYSHVENCLESGMHRKGTGIDNWLLFWDDGGKTAQCLLTFPRLQRSASSVSFSCVIGFDFWIQLQKKVLSLCYL